MASTRFTVLTGHLSQYSLADLIGILRHQRKTGRLLIEYIGSPAILFFKDGNLVDAQYNTLIGVQAIFVAFVQPPAAFNFNPLIQPTRESIDFEQQRVILELLGCWTDDAILVKPITPRDELLPIDEQRPELRSVESHLALSRAPHSESKALPEVDTILALPAGPLKLSLPFRSIRRPWVLAVATFCLLLVFGVPTLIAISSKTRKVSSTPATSQLQNSVAEPTTSSTTVNNTGALAPRPATESTSGAFERKREQVTSKVLSDPVMKNPPSVPAQPNKPAQTDTNTAEPAQAAKTKQPPTTGQTVKVVMRIENGRVVQATVGDRRPGAEAYEALALRIARQRRYPPGVSKQETLLMKVDGPK